MNILVFNYKEEQYPQSEVLNGLNDFCALLNELSDGEQFELVDGNADKALYQFFKQILIKNNHNKEGIIFSPDSFEQVIFPYNTFLYYLNIESYEKSRIEDILNVDSSLIDLGRQCGIETRDTLYDGKCIIVVPNSYHYIEDSLPGSHGLSINGGNFCFLLKGYPNILIHETAHLFGVDDRYIEENVYAMKNKCTAPARCYMRWEPGYKDCIFCDAALEELRKGLR